MSFRRIFRVETSMSPVAGSGLDALVNSVRPTMSDIVRTRVETVAPSRRFLLLPISIERSRMTGKEIETYPSRLDLAISSVNSHKRPRSSTMPVEGSRSGVHSGASRIAGGVRDSLFFATRIMPSSTNCWYEFLRVSLLTASK